MTNVKIEGRCGDLGITCHCARDDIESDVRAVTDECSATVRRNANNDWVRGIRRKLGVPLKCTRAHVEAWVRASVEAALNGEFGPEAGAGA